MGQVYRARDTRLGRTVAVKILTDRLAESPAARQRFEQEARGVPIGQPFLVHHFHDPERRWGSTPLSSAIESRAFVLDQV